MDDLLLSPQVKTHLRALLRDPPHALLIVGVNGIGKFTLANVWASSLTPHVELLRPDEKGTIGIDSVRELYKRTRSKRDDRQVIIIDHAEAMGVDAQNAFLKLLEEPRDGVTFVLTAPNQDLLLPTIVSRVQSLQVNPMPTAQLAEWGRLTRPAINEQELAQMLFVAQGRPATLSAMLTRNEEFDNHKLVMQRAKHLLTATKYERLAQINDLIKDRLQLVETLEAMVHMTKMQIEKTAEVKWLKLADGLQECLSRLAQNANPRAQLLRLLVLY